MTVPDDFTVDGYRALLEALLARGYTGRDFDKVRPERSDVVLRHDIDLWPAYALPIAHVEAELGLSAWYFFLVRSPVYGIADPKTVSVMADLIGMGHSIGLHFDAALFADDSTILDAEAQWECGVLERLTGRPISMVSFHRPQRSLLGRDDLIAGRDHSYRSRYFNDIGYCSDSRGGWRHGHPLDHPAVANGRALQFLTHPIWWATDSRGDANAALAAFETERLSALRTSLAETVTGYSETLGIIQEREDG